MHTKIVPIGTSKGVRLPKYLLEKYHLTDEVCIEDTEEGILITPSDHKARSDWKALFKKVAANFKYKQQFFASTNFLNKKIFSEKKNFFFR